MLEWVPSLGAYGLPPVVALSAVATLGYWFGRNRATSATRDDSMLRELKRTRLVVRELERIAQHVRKNLVTHHASIQEFKSKLAEISTNSDETEQSSSWRALAQEADRLLHPTQFLSAQIAQAYDEIRRQSNQLMSFSEVRADALTGVGNRRTLDETLTTMLAMHDRFGSVFSIVVFDIDRFKPFNDQHGQSAGDDLLKRMARLLDETVRETDVVARFGGAEFVVVLPGTDLVGARRFAERAREQVASSLELTVSAGVTMVRDKDQARGILARADEALYAAKAGGRNLVFEHDGQGLNRVTQDSGHSIPAPRGIAITTESVTTVGSAVSI